MSEVQPEIPRLERDFPVSYAIFAMARTHRAIAAARLGELGLFPNQELLLVQLGAVEAMPQHALAAALRVSHVTVAKMIARMERAGFVARRRSEDDRRVSLVSLTDEGRALQSQVVEVWRGLETLTTGALDHGARAEFVGAATRIRASLDDAAGTATQPEH